MYIKIPHSLILNLNYVMLPAMNDKINIFYIDHFLCELSIDNEVRKKRSKHILD
jgi:vacuolar-type H+-ATPase subunit D/Vma8